MKFLENGCQGILFSLWAPSLLLRRECCTFSNGEYVKSGLAVLEKWITDATEEVNIYLCSQIVHFIEAKVLFSVVCRNLLA